MKRGVKITCAAIIFLIIFSACERKFVPPPLSDLTKRPEVDLERMREEVRQRMKAEEQWKKRAEEMEEDMKRKNSWVTIEDNQKGYRIKVDRHWKMVPGKDKTVERIFLDDRTYWDAELSNRTIYQLEIVKIDIKAKAPQYFVKNKSEAIYIKKLADSTYILRTIFDDLNYGNRYAKLEDTGMAFQGLELFVPNILETDVKLPEDWILFRDDYYKFQIGFPREWVVDEHQSEIRVFFTGEYPQSEPRFIKQNDLFFLIWTQKILKEESNKSLTESVKSASKKLKIYNDSAVWVTRNKKYSFGISTKFNDRTKQRSLQFLEKAISTFQTL